MHVGVLGGTGNISSHIVTRLVDLGHQVTCINRSGQAPNGVLGVVADRDDEPGLRAVVDDLPLDAVIHMLCYNADHAESALRVFAGVKHFIHCSTGSTYGCPWPALPMQEETPFQPLGAYGEHKHAADKVFMQAYRAHGFPVTILKPNTTYGSIWRRWLMGQLPGNMLYRMVRGKPVLLINEGESLHHFLSSSDCAKAFVHCLGREQCMGQVYNSCAHRPQTWRSWVEAIMREIGHIVPVIGVSRSDVLAVWPDLESQATWSHTVCCTEKIRRDVPEFADQQSLEEGVQHLYADWQPSEVEPHSEEIEHRLDDLVSRACRFANS